MFLFVIATASQAGAAGKGLLIGLVVALVLLLRAAFIALFSNTRGKR